MTTVATIIKQAYRESNIIPRGAVLNSEETAEGLLLLQSLVEAIYGDDVGERLSDWMVGAYGVAFPWNLNWYEFQWKYPIQNSRVILNNTTPQTLILPVNPDNGARMQFVDNKGLAYLNNVTIDPNGRTIGGQLSLVLGTVPATLNVTYMYNADTSDWEEVSTITSGGQMPFPAKYDTYFMTALASRINPRYGRALSETTISWMIETKEQLAADYRQTRPMPAPLAVRRLSSPTDRYFGDNRRGRFGWMG